MLVSIYSPFYVANSIADKFYVANSIADKLIKR